MHTNRFDSSVPRFYMAQCASLQLVSIFYTDILLHKQVVLEILFYSTLFELYGMGFEVIFNIVLAYFLKVNKVKCCLPLLFYY